eukprot:5159955-Prymnesium_polylepis.1
MGNGRAGKGVASVRSVGPCGYVSEMRGSVGSDLSALRNGGGVCLGECDRTVVVEIMARRCSSWACNEERKYT